MLTMSCSTNSRHLHSENLQCFQDITGYAFRVISDSDKYQSEILSNRALINCKYFYDNYLSISTAQRRGIITNFSKNMEF